MPTVLQTFRHLRRYQQIGRTLTRYGFGHVLTQLGIGRAITPGLERLRFSSSEVLRASPPERVRMAVEELGPTFIKLGHHALVQRVHGPLVLVGADGIAFAVALKKDTACM